MRVATVVLLIVVFEVLLAVALGRWLRDRGESVEKMFDVDDWDECTCGHPYQVHAHNRKGRDCGVCGALGCARYEAASPAVWWREMAKNFKRGWRDG